MFEHSFLAFFFCHNMYTLNSLIDLISTLFVDHVYCKDITKKYLWKKSGYET